MYAIRTLTESQRRRRANTDQFQRTANLVQRLALELKSPIMLRLMWVFIVAVSFYDIWMVYVCRDVIVETEQNPICLALIKYDPAGLSLFITAKIAGTFFVVAACDRLAARSRELGAQVTSGIAGFQSWLLLYLTV